MQQFDLSRMSVSEIYGLMVRAIVPRPIAWVTTVSSRGVINLAPFSYFCGVSSRPPALAISVATQADGSLKHTAANILASGQFVVNVVPYELADQMHRTSASFPEDLSELKIVGLNSIPSVRVSPPRVHESPVHLECEVLEVLKLADGPHATHLFVGRILLVHVQPAILDERGRIDPDKADIVGRMGGLSYCTTRERFDQPPATASPLPPEGS